MKHSVWDGGGIWRAAVGSRCWETSACVFCPFPLFQHEDRGCLFFFSYPQLVEGQQMCTMESLGWAGPILQFGTAELHLWTFQPFPHSSFQAELVSPLLLEYLEHSTSSVCKCLFFFFLPPLSISHEFSRISCSQRKLSLMIQRGATPKGSSVF